MARGLAEHLEPTTVLGPGGDTFVPSADAAVKPLYPLLLAGLHLFGVPWLTAAAVVTATAAASTVVLAALLASRITGSPWAGAAAGLVLLASPSLGFWSGFSGPDPLAQALGLGAALAFVCRRPVLGGALTGLAIATRPELALLAIAAAAVAARRREVRTDVGRAALAATGTVGLLFAAIRPPLALPDSELLLLAGVAVGCVVVVAFAPARIAACMVALGLGVAAVLVTRASGINELWRHDWPLLVLSAAGVVLSVGDRQRRLVAALLLGGALLLGSVYAVKNPGLERYFVVLLPVAALLAGIAAAAIPRWARPLALGAVALVLVAGVVRPVPGSRDYDVFAVIARKVEPAVPVSAPLVTAAPDAYGFLLPGHTVREMRAGVRGAILLDPAQRLYQPALTAKGDVVLRVADEVAFARPDGELDAAPAIVVTGDVVRAIPRG